MTDLLKLEDIKSAYEHSGPSDDAQPIIYRDIWKHMKWLIDRVDALVEENERYKEALEWYAMGDGQLFIRNIPGALPDVSEQERDHRKERKPFGTRASEALSGKGEKT